MIWKKKISNYEEISSEKAKERDAFRWRLRFRPNGGRHVLGVAVDDQLLIPLILDLIIGACLGLGGFFSFAHLGVKRNAWRTPIWFEVVVEP